MRRKTRILCVVIFSVASIVSCKSNNHSKIREATDTTVGILPYEEYIPTPEDSARQNKILRVTDTICQLKNQRLGNLELVEFCYIRYGTKKTDVNFSQLLTAWHAAKKVDYNYAISKDDDLIYKLEKDTITIRIFYDTGDREWLWEPDTIKSDKGIVILKERKSTKSDKPLAMGIVIDELIYKFRVIKQGKIPKFRWSPDLDN
jgi:hypothetical protein